jgi:hypothetical protein
MRYADGVPSSALGGLPCADHVVSNFASVTTLSGIGGRGYSLLFFCASLHLLEFVVGVWRIGVDAFLGACLGA